MEILAIGRNCYRRSVATKAALLTNTDYFKRLGRSLEHAQHEVILIGWDLDAALVLDPHGDGPAARPLAALLDVLLARRPTLEIRILLWDRVIFYGGNRRCAPALGEIEARHDRFRHHFAPTPFGTSHHAKLVTIDRGLAFIGGIDLAGDRWDAPDHQPDHPARITPAGDAYGPLHDLQSIVAGPAAAALADYAAERWTAATGESLPQRDVGPAAWPDDVEPDFVNIPVGFARTDPTGARAVREIEALNLAALRAARRLIYIEAQYLTAETVGDALAQHLAEPDGPEIVIVVTRTSQGLLEHFAMGTNRDRLLRRLRAADRWGHLRAYHATTTDPATEIKIHSKLLLVDDRFLRIGSSNFNNRSLSVDTECDLALEALHSRHRRQIRAVRNRLIAAQLQQPLGVVAAAFRHAPSLIAAIESLNGAGRLRPLPEAQKDGPCEPVPGTILLDPSEPLTLARLWSAGGSGTPTPLPYLDAGKQATADEEGD
jgi:phosphatidylserine/phosphatidylglycerophosphate/cardiolipin synthase-like enzyme